MKLYPALSRVFPNSFTARISAVACVRMHVRYMGSLQLAEEARVFVLRGKILCGGAKMYQYDKK